MRIVLGVLCLIFFYVCMNACSSYKLANKYIDRKFAKASMKLDTLKTDEYTIEYWDNKAENKPVFLVLHGFGAKTKYQWFKQLSVLKEDYRVVIPNLMYFGRTTPKKQNKFSVQDQVEMIQHFLQQLKIEKYHLMGASYGGLISIETARQFPNQVTKLFLVDAPVKYIEEKDQLRICEQFGVESLTEMFVPSSPAEMRMLLHVSKGKKQYVPLFVLKDFHKEFYVKNKDELESLMEHLLEVREEYSKFEYKLTMPVHLLWGDTDMLIPPERAKKLQKHLGDTIATLDIIKNGGHMPNLNKPKKFNALLIEYLKK